MADVKKVLDVIFIITEFFKVNMLILGRAGPIDR